MEHPFFTATTTRAEALRWLTISEKLLSARDLMGSKSFAMRARDSDPTLSPADEILAVVDTLLAGDRRIGNNHHDWYAILRLTPQQGRDSELIANQYRTLVLQLNPQKNKFPFAEQAFRLVVDSWSVLSNPSRKSLYDKELAFYLQQQQQQQQQPDPFNDPIPALQQNFIFFGGGAASQPQVHGGGSSSSGVSHYPQVQQVHAQPVVEPVVSGSTRVPQNFMSFSSGTNILFGSGSGSGSGSKSGHEQVSNQGQESYSNFGSNKQKEPQQNYFSVADKTAHNVSGGGNVGGTVEDQGDVDTTNVQEERVEAPDNEGGSTFWTACPYCYYMYEYPGEYADCTLRCQKCKRAFQGVAVSSPPPSVEGQEGYFCCWGFLPLGFSMDNWEKNRGAAPAWTPFSPMFTCPRMENSVKRKVGGRKSSAPRVYVDDDEVFVEISGSSESDDDWRADKEKKRQNKTKNVKGKGPTGTPSKNAKKARIDKGKNVNIQDGVVSPHAVEIPNKTINEPVKIGAAGNGRKQPGRVVKNFGKLDLNVEFSNEAEEPAPRANQGNGPGRGEDDNIEGIGFFEGLDEFLNSLPILNVVGDDKVVKAA
ncbi:hypothetical protein BUALT_Bualt15G0063200 [Buddleja alternifolia]|uniref:J domain-containing protein n=1 Tax=Buddleja alternifolia TaxID=168488 RepID=A0AAV6WD46_9LAMI|nr:hypothetical protein BUALT_Bualt15G0063200 [Buddleja alternifolia]